MHTKLKWLILASQQTPSNTSHRTPEKQATVICPIPSRCWGQGVNEENVEEVVRKLGNANRRGNQIDYVSL